LDPELDPERVFGSVRRVRTVSPVAKRRWRFYETSAGRKVVREQLDALDADHAAEITAAMAEVRREGRRAAKHLRGDVWEVKADYKGLAYRVLFAEEGDEGHVCLALELFTKKSQKTPPQTIALAERRLRDWRSRGRDPGR
jgi:phage-related protein